MTRCVISDGAKLRASWRAGNAASACLGLLVLGLLAGCRIDYLVQQSAGQIAMLSRRESLAASLQEPSVHGAVRDRLQVVWYARRFAIDRVGLHASQSYRDVVWLDRDAASYVVAAAPRDSLRPYRWCYPVAGCLPYIGFFDRRNAVREQRRMEALGFDVQLRGTPAYSLGGWLPDPVYSPLLTGSRYRVADTVIHELSHGTVFLPGRAAFNEGFATFVGDHGGMQFLVEHYGAGSATVRAAQREQRESDAYSALLHDLTVQLRTVYASGLARPALMARREAVFAYGRARIAALAFRSPRFARLARRPLNNAVLATQEVYFGAGARFDAVFERCDRDLARFVRFVHGVVARERDPEAFLAGAPTRCAR